MVGSPTERLAMLLCSDHAQRFVILDNLETADELRAILPPASTLKHVVVVTSPQGTHDPGRAQFIHVKQMNTVRLIRWLSSLARAYEPRGGTVCHSFHGYPLVIRYACELFAEQRQTVYDFCHDLRDDVLVSRTIPILKRGEVCSLFYAEL